MSWSTFPLLAVAGSLSLLASALHVAVLFGGPAWYRRFGAGERIARLAEAGHWYPVVVTSFVALMLLVWAGYAFSGASLLPRFPLLKPALCAIAGVYLLRGLVIVPMVLFAFDRVTGFWVWSSLVCLIYAAAYGLGLIQAWPRL
ncbi:hypothetical protein [Frateuria defendens]|uniref:hypothetical protein n=1 Tax=Frateuria defendens TaxID=2219559 RepID=UPI00066FBC07|nr:hypothetical protein [Frateuria defendens]